VPKLFYLRVEVEDRTNIFLLLVHRFAKRTHCPAPTRQWCKKGTPRCPCEQAGVTPSLKVQHGEGWGRKKGVWVGVGYAEQPS
jgi:hypothetical protein